jgi:hypothetical protein
VNEGAQLKLFGIKQAASHHKVDLQRAKGIAELMGKFGRVITSDDVRDLFRERHGYELEIGNALAALFKGKKWIFCGRVKSRRKEAHNRYICSWRLKA